MVIRQNTGSRFHYKIYIKHLLWARYGILSSERTMVNKTQSLTPPNEVYSLMMNTDIKHMPTYLKKAMEG